MSPTAALISLRTKGTPVNGPLGSPALILLRAASSSTWHSDPTLGSTFLAISKAVLRSSRQR